MISKNVDPKKLRITKLASPQKGDIKWMDVDCTRYQICLKLKSSLTMLSFHVKSILELPRRTPFANILNLYSVVIFYQTETWLLP